MQVFPCITKIILLYRIGYFLSRKGCRKKTAYSPSFVVENVQTITAPFVQKEVVYR